jgi:2-polyprenyl-6-methoxyphenol hydroxylase-like FAD-dependent oxidoreductase
MESTRIGPDDALIVGSGINSLACAATLPRSGREVRVLERESVLGGCIRTDELTLPGMRRDTAVHLAPHQPRALRPPLMAKVVAFALEAVGLPPIALASAARNRQTHVRHLWHIGASGFHVAKAFGAA